MYNKKRIWCKFSAYLVSDLHNPKLQWILLFSLPVLLFTFSLFILIFGMDVFIVFLMVSALMGGGGVVVPHFLKVFPDQPCNYFGEINVLFGDVSIRTQRLNVRY